MKDLNEFERLDATFAELQNRLKDNIEANNREEVPIVFQKIEEQAELLVAEVKANMAWWEQKGMTDNAAYLQLKEVVPGIKEFLRSHREMLIDAGFKLIGNKNSL